MEYLHFMQMVYLLRSLIHGQWQKTIVRRGEWENDEIVNKTSQETLEQHNAPQGRLVRDLAFCEAAAVVGGRKEGMGGDR